MLLSIALLTVWRFSNTRVVGILSVYRYNRYDRRPAVMETSQWNSAIEESHANDIHYLSRTQPCYRYYQARAAQTRHRDQSWCTLYLR
ncbi:hypothetical protein J6590_063217 [Homalodisca vitripennis]|nr:hypothetical protein J6590_063217 [Homalodisca vitripennis]